MVVLAVDINSGCFRGISVSLLYGHQAQAVNPAQPEEILLLLTPNGGGNMKRIIFEAGEKLKAIESKLTARRELTLRVLLENRGKHLSAEEVYNLVKRDAADVGLATVWGTGAISGGWSHPRH